MKLALSLLAMLGFLFATIQDSTAQSRKKDNPNFHYKEGKGRAASNSPSTGVDTAPAIKKKKKK